MLRGQLSSCRFLFFVCFAGLVLLFCFLALVFVSVFLSAYDDDIGLCKGPPTARLLLIHLFTRWQNLQLLQLIGKCSMQ